VGASMISIITGTYNRRHLLEQLISNTVESNKNLELVLVDGGSTDNTIPFLEDLNHSRIKLIKVAGRSTYPHYMNLAIENASHDYVCQWNDDVLLVNAWDEVMAELDDSGVYIFNWKYGTSSDLHNEDWLFGDQHENGWFLSNDKQEDEDGAICVNYGIYHKKVFRTIGMYDDKFAYYYADGDLAQRAWYSKRYNIKTLRHIKVLAFSDTPKVAIHFADDKEKYDYNMSLYKEKLVPNTIRRLGDDV
tara:strand:+ start:1441 stop:2181 length:741 start_codon:yes stop_codon:yes gene_type:complete